MMHIGLVDFAEPTLLIIGDMASLRWLAELIETRQSLDFGAAASQVKLVNVSLLLDSVRSDGDLSRDQAKFDWRISPSEAGQFAVQLRSLAASDVPAHAYLDCNSNTSGVQIVASKDEYSARTVFNL